MKIFLRDRDKKGNNGTIQRPIMRQKSAASERRPKMAEEHGYNERYDNNEQRTDVRVPPKPSISVTKEFISDARDAAITSETAEPDLHRTASITGHTGTLTMSRSSWEAEVL